MLLPSSMDKEIFTVAHERYVELERPFGSLDVVLSNMNREITRITNQVYVELQRPTDSLDVSTIGYEEICDHSHHRDTCQACVLCLWLGCSAVKYEQEYTSNCQ
jgi:hypothetical protein